MDEFFDIKSPGKGGRQVCNSWVYRTGILKKKKMVKKCNCIEKHVPQIMLIKNLSIRDEAVS